MRVLITGITGMDGSILADLFLQAGHEVYGLIRRSTSTHHWRIEHLAQHERLHLIEGDVTAPDSVYRAIQMSEPEQIYHLASQSFVPYSWASPAHTLQVTAIGTLNVLEAIRGMNKSIRMYHAASSEMFGQVLQTPQSETTPFYPRSPYAIAKLAAHNLTINYHESFGIHACSGILFNHEHERRGENFVTRKITKGVAHFFYQLNQQQDPTPIRLGNLEAKRDWGYAEDYVKAMIKILTYSTPETFVIATGTTRTVRSFCEEAVRAAATHLGLPVKQVQWQGKGENEIGYYDHKPIFVVAKEFFRPAEVELLLGDASRARRELNWAPEVTFEEMVARMFAHDYSLLMNRPAVPKEKRIRALHSAVSML